MLTISHQTSSVEQTQHLGETIGRSLKGGEVLNLKSDLGGGKTTFVRGLAKGFGSNDPVASPSFTISYVYSRADKKELHHFDFYRLTDPGIMELELQEVLNDQNNVVAIEWGDQVLKVISAETITVTIKNIAEEEREFTFTYPEDQEYLFLELGKGNI